MKTNTSVPDSERTGENRIIRRDTECIEAAAGLYFRLSEAEADRHLLIVLLRQARAQLAAAELDRDQARRNAARWERCAIEQASR